MAKIYKNAGNWLEILLSLRLEILKKSLGWKREYL